METEEVQLESAERTMNGAKHEGSTCSREETTKLSSHSDESELNTCWNTP